MKQPLSAKRRKKGDMVTRVFLAEKGIIRYDRDSTVGCLDTLYMEVESIEERK